MSDITITFTYDHASGLYYGRIGKGAKFPVRRQDVGGRLENALTQFKKAVIEENSGRFVQARTKRPLNYEYPEHRVRQFDEHGNEIKDDFELWDDLDLELDLGQLKI